MGFKVLFKRLICLAVIYLLSAGFTAMTYEISMTGEYQEVRSEFELILAFLARFLRSFPYLIIIIVIANWLGYLLAPTSNFIGCFGSWICKRSTSLSLISLLALLSFITQIYVILNYAGAIPHVPDSYGYIFQAKLFANGKLFSLAPPFYNLMPLPSVVLKDGIIFSQYPFGHPLILAFGILINAVWLIPPIVSTLSLILVYLIGSKIGSSKIGIISALLLASAPFFQMQSVDYMSHNTAALFLLLTLLFWLKLNDSMSHSYGILFGASLGMLLNTRPYTAALFTIPFVFFAITELTNNNITTKKFFSKYVASVLTFLIFVIAFLTYNKILVGAWLTTPYSFGYLSTFGFPPSRPLSFGLEDLYTSITVLSQILWNYPWELSFVWVLTCILFPRQYKEEGLLWGLVIALVAGYFFYQGTWIMYGPRLWYEAIPILAIISGIGVSKLINCCSIVITRLEGNSYKLYQLQPVTSTVIVIILLTFNVIQINNWFTGKQSEDWQLDFTPKSIHQLSNFNYANRDLIDTLEKLPAERAIVFIDIADSQWWHFGVQSLLIDHDFNGKWLIFLDQGRHGNYEVMQAYPDRKAYYANYYTGQVYELLNN